MKKSLAMRSARAAPPCVNISSNDCRRAPSISFKTSPCVPMVSAMVSAEPLKVSITSSLRDRMVSVMLVPACSNFLTTSSPRQVRSRIKESPVAFSAELTSSLRRWQWLRQLRE